MALGNNLQFAAGGNIKPARFIKLDPTRDHTVLQAGNAEGALVVGISEEGSYNAPIPGQDTTYLAVAGAHVPHRAPGDEAMLVVGEDVSPGDLLEPNADGAGVIAGSGEVAAARVVMGATNGNKAKVVILGAGQTVA